MVSTKADELMNGTMWTPLHILINQAQNIELCVGTPQFITERTYPFRIISVNAEWLRTCGYLRDEVIGATPKILQGTMTDQSALEDLMWGIKAGRPVTVSLTNYYKNGKPFHFKLHVESCNQFNEGDSNVNDVPLLVATMFDIKDGIKKNIKTASYPRRREKNGRRSVYRCNKRCSEYYRTDSLGKSNISQKTRYRRGSILVDETRTIPEQTMENHI